MSIAFAFCLSGFLLVYVYALAAATWRKLEGSIPRLDTTIARMDEKYPQTEYAVSAAYRPFVSRNVAIWSTDRRVPTNQPTVLRRFDTRSILTGTNLCRGHDQRALGIVRPGMNRRGAAMFV